MAEVNRHIPFFDFRWIALVGLVLGTIACAEDQPGLVGSKFIYEQGSVSFPQCHASTIAQTTSGGLVAAWFGGTKEGNPDVSIWVSRQVDGKWSAPVEVANGADENPRVNALNPVLFQVPSGPLMLFYKTGKWWAYILRSTDGGATWSPPERMYNGFFGPVKNKPVLLTDGSILSPTSTEYAGEGWRVHFERSTNGGKTWIYQGPVNDGKEIDAIQPSILFYPGNRLQALGRTKQGRLFQIWSTDGGKSWGEMSLMDLPNPNSGTDAVTLKDGRQLLVYNHTGTFPDKNTGRMVGHRSPLNVAISSDGKQWHAALVLEDEPRKEFSYPAVIQTSDGLVHITYTYRRQMIKHVVLDPAKLRTKPIVQGVWPQ